MTTETQPVPAYASRPVLAKPLTRSDLAHALPVGDPVEDLDNDEDYRQSTLAVVMAFQSGVAVAVVPVEGKP